MYARKNVCERNGRKNRQDNGQSVDLVCVRYASYAYRTHAIRTCPYVCVRSG
jgi:hypothetical protein